MVAGNRLELAPEFGNPPRVHDVGRDDVQRYRGVGGNDHFLVGVGRAQAVGFARSGIDVLPDVLAADHGDVQRFAVGRQLALGAREHAGRSGWRAVAAGARVRRVLDRAELGERQHRERHEDHRRSDGPADLQAGVAADLRRHGALARAELDQRVDQRALDRHEDHERHIQRDLVEAVDLVGVRRSARLRGEEREHWVEQMAQGGGDSIQAWTGRA